jgi:serine phosphatase RsbU (regulator of sigma subunit)
MTIDTSPALAAGRPGRRRRSDTEPRHTSPPPSDPRALAALRRQALNHLATLATAQQERFGRLTRLACDLFDVAFAAVAIPDEASFWVKSSFGTWCPEYPIDHKFFRDALASSAVTICPDTARDPRWSDVLQVVGGQIRFFASVPLRDSNGADLGVFCIGDRRRRELDDASVYLLKEIAGWVERELTAASDTPAVGVQDRLVPETPPQIDGYEVAAVTVPAGDVGGDLYDWVRAGDDVALMLADVEGQDATAAIICATLRAALRVALYGDRGRDDAPFAHMAEMVAKTANLLEGDLRRVQKLAAVFLATVSPREHRLTWVDAGHGLAVLAHEDGSFNWLGRGGLPLGLNAGRHWEQHHCTFAPGDTLLLFSDGLLARDGGLCSSLADVQEMLRQSRRPSEIITKISDLLAVLSPTEDVTVIAVQRQ